MRKGKTVATAPLDTNSRLFVLDGRIKKARPEIAYAGGDASKPNK